ncbi:MAG: 23S rRNA (pseudouridine(1915)-N(3))-methyltransferase RlmH, partial [Candidatus Onthovivens sp.]|nr:23S rRNA (pseudouridine(1915)-N(3))-methyltransferase RlmH [Candidatus Onthovivens sp.]
ANFIENQGIVGNSNIVFIIGGSLGISQEVIKRANEKICFSKMTFPHQLFRVMLLEQIYRGFRIMKNEPYHK